MASPSAQPEDGDHIVDINGVVWLIRLDTSRANARWRATVDRDSVRAYDTPDEDPEVFLDAVPEKSTAELTQKINAFAGPLKQNLVLRVRASPDTPSGGFGALALLVIALLILDSKR